MDASTATMLYYRGYLIEARLCDGSALAGPRQVWVVIQTGPGGAFEELGLLNSERAAKMLIDKLTAPARAGAMIS